MTDGHALPLYIRLSELLIREIKAGRYSEGERLPPEREMARTLNTSVGTLRKALADLTEKGMLERRQGSGNYVRAQSDAKAIYAFFRYELIEGGGLPTAALLSLESLPKTAAPDPFGASDRAHRIRRLRSLNGRPAVLEEVWLDGGYAPAIDPADLSESLYYYYRERLDLWIARVEDRVGLSPVPDWAPAAFDPQPGQAALCVRRRGWDQHGAAAELSLNWVDTAVAAYVSRHG